MWFQYVSILPLISSYLTLCPKTTSRIQTDSKEWAVSKKTMTIHDPFVEKMMLWQLCLLVWYTRRFEVARRKERQPCLAFKRPVTLRKEHVLIQFRCALQATRHTPHDEDETQRNEDESQNQKVRHETHRMKPWSISVQVQTAVVLLQHLGRTMAKVGDWVGNRLEVF